MPTHSAAPGAVGGGLRGGLTTAGNTASITEIGLPAHVVDLLAREGVRTLADWQALGRKRHQLFGVTRAMVRRLDAMAREASR